MTHDTYLYFMSKFLTPFHHSVTACYIQYSVHHAKNTAAMIVIVLTYLLAPFPYMTGEIAL